MLKGQSQDSTPGQRDPRVQGLLTEPPCATVIKDLESENGWDQTVQGGVTFPVVSQQLRSCLGLGKVERVLSVRAERLHEASCQRWT